MRDRRSLLALCLVAGCASEPLPTRGDSSVRDGGARDSAGSVVDAAGADAATAIDARTDAARVDADVGSRCLIADDSVSCTHDTLVVRTGTTALTDRDVHFQVPMGEPPPGGFPVVLVFQGSTLSADRAWSAVPTDLFGMYYQTLLVARLLDAGYAVIAPEAAGDGLTFYDTNVPPYATFWETAPDHQLMLEIFAGIERGDYGAIDPSALFAAGFSSGGYMSSRMAVSYPGRFRALAINSGAYATCVGPACILPATLPSDHPPTLFLHGELDPAVPMTTMMTYEAALRGQGVATRVVTDPAIGHQWIAAAPVEVLAWFDASR